MLFCPYKCTASSRDILKLKQFFPSNFFFNFFPLWKTYLPLRVYQHDMPLCDIWKVKDIYLNFQLDLWKQRHKYRFCTILMDSLPTPILIISWYSQFKYSLWDINMHSIDGRYSKDAAITIDIILPVSSPLETRICYYMCVNIDMPVYDI